MLEIKQVIESVEHTHAGHHTRSSTADVEIIDKSLVGNDDGVDARVKSLETRRGRSALSYRNLNGSTAISVHVGDGCDGADPIDIP
jgi:hypothetical protein